MQSPPALLVLHNRHEQVKYLLSLGADPSVPNSLGQTPQVEKTRPDNIPSRRTSVLPATPC